MPLYNFKEYYPVLSEDTFIAPGAMVIGRVQVGPRSGIWYNAVLRGDIAEIQIGSESNIQDNVTVHVDWDIPTIIGDKATIGHNAVLHACKIGDGCLIGMGAVLLNKVEIGEDSLIAAGCLITPGTVIPPRSLVMGSPGKIVRTLEEDQLPVKTGAYLNYVKLARAYVDSQQS